MSGGDRPANEGSEASGRPTAPGPRRRAVVVAGMHRSGTSALSHAIAIRGLQLPRTPMGPSSGNPRGHWGESEPIRHLHDELLEAAGSAWDDPAPFPAEWRHSPAGQRWRERMTTALADEYPGDEPFLFKDPRICRLIPFWRDVLDDLGVEPAFVLPVRNPLEVAASLRRRDEFDQAKGLMLWLRHSLDAERDTRGAPRALVAYEDLLRDWRAALDRIAERTGFVWPLAGHEADLEVERTLSAGQRHHEFSDEDLEARREVADWVKLTYRALLAGCRPQGEADQAELDDVGAAIDQAELAYGPLLAAERLDARELRELLEAERREHDDRVLAYEAAVAELEATAAERGAELERTRRERDTAQASLAETRDELQRLRRRSPVARLRSLAAMGRPTDAHLATLRQLGAWTLRPPSLRGLRMAREFAALRDSPYFSRSFYLQRNPDVARSGMNPVMHYIEHGARAGLDPSPLFSTRDYLVRHPELERSGVNPLYHFQRAQRSRGRSATRSGARRRTSDPDGPGSGPSGGPLGPYAPPAPTPAAAPALATPATDRVPPEELRRARDLLAARGLTVSVVVATRDRATSLERALESAFAQSYEPSQVIVCDDASSDGTEEMLRARFAGQLESGRLVYLRNERRLGPSAARNRALAEARGDVVAYLDSDNSWYPDFLLLMAAALAERDDAATAYCGIAFRSDDGPPQLRRFPYDRDQLLIRNQIDLNAFVHRRRLIDQLGGFDEGMSRLVDWDLILRHTRRYAPVEVPYCLVDYYGGERGERVTHTADFESNAAIVRRRFAHERAYAGHAPLRVGYVLWDWPALSQTFVANEIRDLIRRGYDVHVYHHADPDRAAQLDFDVPTFRVADPDALAELLRAHGRTLVHSHFAYPAVTRLAWPAARAAGVPFTFMVHAVDIFHRANVERNRIAEIAADELCVRVLCYGRFHRAYLIDRGVPAQKISLTRQAAQLPDPPREEIAARIARPSRVVASIARFVEKKGLADLVRAAALLPEDTEVRLYGYGPLEQPLRSLAAAGGASVRFMGVLETHADVAAALRDADVFALPCIVDRDGDMDGLPTVIGEAMAAGVPVVTTNVSAIPEVVEDGLTGLLAPPGEPEALARRIEDALALTGEPLRELIDRARDRALATWGVERTAEALAEVWERAPLDVVMVTHGRDASAAATTGEIVRRVYELTTTPFNLTIIDNASTPEYRDALAAMVAGRPNAALTLLERNARWGPALNVALAQARSDVVVYVCSNEGFALAPGWERAYVEHLRSHRDVALAGHPISSPAFPTGSDYQAQPWFEGFRNKHFAAANADREFMHVQGGLFAIRRAAFERCGGFSEAVAQDAADVEYSYYLESLGWKLGRVPQIPSLTVKTRPGLHAHLDEHTLAAHPLALDSAALADRVAAGIGAYCNVCSWAGDSFEPDGAGAERCPRCRSTPVGRLAFRYLAASPLPHRGLDCAAMIADDGLQAELGEMFSLTRLPPDRLNGALDTDRDVIVADLGHLAGRDAVIATATLAAALGERGTILIGGLGPQGPDRDGSTAEEELAGHGLRTEWFAPVSDVVRFDRRGLLVGSGARVRARAWEPAGA